MPRCWQRVYTGDVNDREFRKHLTEKRLEAIRAEVRAEKKSPALAKPKKRVKPEYVDFADSRGGLERRLSGFDKHQLADHDTALATGTTVSAASVTDSTTAVWGAAYTAGGGTNHVGIRFNGSHWTVFAK